MNLSESKARGGTENGKSQKKHTIEPATRRRRETELRHSAPTINRRAKRRHAAFKTTSSAEGRWPTTPTAHSETRGRVRTGWPNKRKQSLLQKTQYAAPTKTAEETLEAVVTSGRRLSTDRWHTTTENNHNEATRAPYRREEERQQWRTTRKATRSKL